MLLGKGAWKSGNFFKRTKRRIISSTRRPGWKIVLKKYMDQICKISATSEEELVDKDTKDSFNNGNDFVQDKLKNIKKVYE